MKISLVVALLSLSCATVPKHAGTDPVPLGSWCHDVGAAFCRTVGDRCMGGLSGFAEGCNNTAVPSCLAGREASRPSGRSYAELDRCVHLIQSLSCEGLGAGIGSGSLAEPCAAR